MVGYGLVVALVALTRLDQPGMLLILGAHLGLPLLAYLAAHAREDGIGGMIRIAYPIVILSGLYSSIDVLNGFGSAATWDRQLQALEFSVFNSQPSRDWWQAAPSDFWSTVMHGVYFSYYIIVPLPVAVLMVKGRRAETAAYLNGVIATFLACYLCYIFFPVAGPYYEFAHPTGEFVANAPARIVYAALARGSSFGAAFPSSHVAATAAATIGAWRTMPRLGMALLVPTILLAVGVVYCQMHYVIDSDAGLALGAAIPLLISLWSQPRREGESAQGGPSSHPRWFTRHPG